MGRYLESSIAGITSYGKLTVLLHSSTFYRKILRGDSFLSPTEKYLIHESKMKKSLKFTRTIISIQYQIINPCNLNSFDNLLPYPNIIIPYHSKTTKLQNCYHVGTHCTSLFPFSQSNQLHLSLPAHPNTNITRVFPNLLSLSCIHIPTYIRTAPTPNPISYHPTCNATKQNFRGEKNKILHDTSYFHPSTLPPQHPNHPSIPVSLPLKKPRIIPCLRSVVSHPVTDSRSPNHHAHTNRCFHLISG